MRRSRVASSTWGNKVSRHQSVASEATTTQHHNADEGLLVEVDHDAMDFSKVLPVDTETRAGTDLDLSGVRAYSA